MKAEPLKRGLVGVFSYLVLLFTVCISLVPLLWIVVSSFKSNKAILNTPFALPVDINFHAYYSVLKMNNFLSNTTNSVLISVTSTLIALLFYALAAYSFAKFDFKGKHILFVLFSITLLIPGHATAQPIFSFINLTGLYDTRLALIVVYISAGLAVSLFILRAAFLSIPRELDEAAYMESATFWQVFFYINLPLAKSGLATAGILMFLGNWNEFFYGFMLTASAENRTLPVALQFFTEQFSYNYTQLFAALTLVTLPSIILYMVAQEQVQQSVVSGGVKG
ncbi:carbohydrate ABC transporter permease [Paenibacillus lignilyticus]|uniref:Carbohydrate ABC transporter permease n=1 Tax=Paenibacillus lignilyticus TaxID=1172615 RepID=A0ABS5CE80_9BACL|nr:carbohydrate ABC transporter permease [Paenibacillus lignilyticus]MBP3961590.1 carbohydrate ABC transporter permease [Paenibacillus lignilyticus]MBP3963740.1 carbohydrate ABC transporter permease [Paenibacillus lignilyticus]